jgi:hypothetical protein
VLFDCKYDNIENHGAWMVIKEKGKIGVASTFPKIKILLDCKYDDYCRKKGKFEGIVK